MSADDDDPTSEYEREPIELEATEPAVVLELDSDLEPRPDPLEEDPTSEFEVHREPETAPELEPLPELPPLAAAPIVTEPPPAPAKPATAKPATTKPPTAKPAAETPNTPSRSPSTALVRMIRPNAAVILLGAVFLLAVIEIIAAFLAYRQHISDEDWDEVAALLETHQAETLIVASDWLGPRARMELAPARTWDSVAPPDLRGLQGFWVLSFGRDSWTPALRAELEDLPTPELIAIHTVGDLMLAEFRQDAAGERLWSLLDRDLEIESDAGRCAGKQGRWNCKDGRAQTRVIEVDYRPRRCLALAFDDGVVAKIDLGEVELGNRLRGHVGFGDFNARLRADPIVVVEAWIDDRLATRWLFTDDQGWAAFALATEPGLHELELRVLSSLSGTWQREGHRPLPTDTVCLEVRAFDEAEPEPEVEP